MSYFAQSKREPEKKGIHANGSEPRLDVKPASGNASRDIVSTLGSGMLITGNVVCAGSVQIFGRVQGDIHVAQLIICEGAHVEGNVIAQETVIDGYFKGTIRGNNVRLQGTAVVDGEIFNKSLTIEQNAQFEGVSRRLDHPVEPPSSTQAKGEVPLAPSMAEPVQAS